MTDPYSYNFEEDVNPYTSSNNADLQDVNMVNTPTAPPKNLPPPPTSNFSTSNWDNTNSNTTTVKDTTVKTTTVKKTVRTMEKKELTGRRAYKIFGFASVGNLPFPFINPNYFSYIRFSGHWVIVPVSFFEVFLVTFVLLLNALGQWFFLGGSITNNTNWPSYIALRLVWAHVILCLTPALVFAKYAAIFRACTEKNTVVKAPLYLLFLLFAFLTIALYIAMWTGGVGSGLFSGIYLLIGGLVGGIKPFALFTAAYDFIVSIGWILLIVCCLIEILGMARNFYLYRKAQKEATVAMNAV